MSLRYRQATTFTDENAPSLLTHTNNKSTITNSFTQGPLKQSLSSSQSALKPSLALAPSNKSQPRKILLDITQSEASKNSNQRPSNTSFPSKKSSSISRDKLARSKPLAPASKSILKTPQSSVRASNTVKPSAKSQEFDGEIELFAGKSGRERDAEEAKISLLDYIDPCIMEDLDIDPLMDHPDQISRNVSFLLESIFSHVSKTRDDDLIIVPDSIDLDDNSNSNNDNPRNDANDVDIPLAIDTFDFHL